MRSLNMAQRLGRRFQCLHCEFAFWFASVHPPRRPETGRNGSGRIATILRPNWLLRGKRLHECCGGNRPAKAMARRLFPEAESSFTPKSKTKTKRKSRVVTRNRAKSFGR